MVLSFSDYIHKASMCRKKVRSDNRQFDNVDYTQLTETDNGFFDSQVGKRECTIRYKIQFICITTLKNL